MKVVVGGLVATYPLGGVAWDYLAYVKGFEALGCEVLYLEDTGQWLYHPQAGTFVPDASFHVRYLKRTLRQISEHAAKRWALRGPDGSYYGWTAAQVEQFCRQADLFLNVSGSCWLRDQYRGARCLAYLDSDPGYTQAKLWAVEHGTATEDECFSAGLIRAHTHFFTLAQNIGAGDCLLPSCGLEWKPTRQPVVLSDWPFTFTPSARRFTTVMSWKIDVRPPQIAGVQYGDKDIEFLKFLDLPKHTPAWFQVAVSGKAPRDELCRHGWQVIDGYTCSRTMGIYRRFLQHSRGEWSVAKNAYVATRSGWFATRSAAYLASGKPVVLQDTGFSRILPTGEGLFAFRTSADAIAALERIESNYRRHCEAARDLAETYFGAEQVLMRLLQDCGLA